MSIRVVDEFTPASLETPATALEPKSTARRAPLERRKPQLSRLWLLVSETHPPCTECVTSQKKALSWQMRNVPVPFFTSGIVG